MSRFASINLHRLTLGVLVVILSMLALHHVVLTLSTMASYFLAHPYTDEFRLTYRYLTMRFPDSVLALENGHRPVIPGALRWFGLVHMNGSLSLQTAASAIAVLVSVLMIGREVLRGLPGRTLLQAAAAALISALVLWNANWRMFIHTNELAHIALVTVGVVAAIVAALNACESGRVSHWIVALACSVAATFSFGTGIAGFAAIFVVAILYRARLQVLALIVGVALTTLLIYLYSMPGGDGVRQVVGTSTFSAAALFSIMRLGAVAAEFTRGNAAIAAMVGLLCVVFVLTICFRFLRGQRFSRLQIFSLALFSFAACANLVIAASRAAYFFEYPDQVFANRYLYWSCLLWLGIALFGLTSVRADRRAETATALVIAFLAAAAVVPGAKGNRWAKNTFEETESTAAALHVGLHVDSAIEPVSDGGAEVAYRLIAELRRRHLGDFSDGENTALGIRLTIESAPSPQLALQLSAPVPGTPIAGQQVKVVLPRDIAESIPHQFLLSDTDGHVVGAVSKAGQSRYPRNFMRLGLPRFDVLLGWTAAQPPTPLLLLEPIGHGKYRSVAQLIR